VLWAVIGKDGTVKEDQSILVALVQAECSQANGTHKTQTSAKRPRETDIWPSLRDVTA